MMKKNIVRLKAVVTASLVLLILPVCIWAQLSTSKIEGVVRDKDTGSPLAGVQIVVEGTRLGNVTNSDGYFFILNVPPGRRSVVFTYTGYQKTTIANQLLLAGQTTTIETNLSSTIVQLEGIIIEGESEVLLPRDNTVSKQRLTAERMNEIPASSLDELMAMEAGVQTGGDDALGRGMRIRGGRLGEEGVIVDGVAVRNYTANPYESGVSWEYEQESGSLAQDASPMEFSTSSLEQVDIITGGFQAEYGNAQSGIINIVTKEGGPLIRGDVRYTTDQVNPRTSDFGYNQLRVSMGGPLKIVPNLFFHTSGEIQGRSDRNPTHADEGFRGINQDFVDKLNEAVADDPILKPRMPVYSLDMFKNGWEGFATKMGLRQSLFSPGNPVRLPGNFGDRHLTSSKLTYSPTQNLKMVSTGSFSRLQNSYPWDDDGNYFMDGRMTKSRLPTRDWDFWGPDTEVTIHQAYGRRTRTTNFLAGFDWDMLRTSERSAALQFRYTNFRSQDISSSSMKHDYDHDTWFMGWTPHDMPFEIEIYPDFDGDGLLRELPVDPVDYNWLPDGRISYYNLSWEVITPLGVDILGGGGENLYYLTYRYMREVQNNFKTDLDFQWNRWNRLKAGVQATVFDNNLFSIYGSRKTRDLQNEFNYRPRLYGAYIQNRTDLGDFVLDYGIRYDHFVPVDNWGLRYGDEYEERYFPKTIGEISPRFDVGFPVTDRSQLRFSYGVFSQLPSFSFIFSNRNPGGLEYSRTDAFEVGLSYLASDDVVVDIVAYYRDVDGNLAQKDFFRDYYQWHSERRIRGFSNGYTNRDSGNIKGVDFTMRKRFSNNFSYNLMYTLQFSRTTGSTYNSTSTWWFFMDPSTGESFRPPDEIRPIDGDQTHKFTGQINYTFSDDFRQGTLANKILKNVRVFSVISLGSGTPLVERITSEGKEGANQADRQVSWLTRYAGSTGNSPVGGINYFRGRWKYDVSLRLSKGFEVGGSKRISGFLEFFNLLNQKNGWRYGSAGYEGAFDDTGGVTLYWSESLPLVQKGKFASDFNNDGVLTPDEQTLGNIARGKMNSWMNKKSWGRAREIRTGIGFSF